MKIFARIFLVIICSYSFTVLAKTALVTGGAGFIGSHLCDRLISENYTVLCLDNLFTGSLDNIKHLREHKNFSFIKHDVIYPFECDEHIDEIYNLACPASPVHYQYNPVKTIKTNVLGMTNMLELARVHNAKIFQASTSEVYGDPAEHPQTEAYWGNVNPIGIRSCYDEGKRCAETLCMDYHRQYGVRIKIGRIFNTYGPRMAWNDGRVISNFVVQALRDQDITIYGTGEQTRSFCYVSDLVEVIRRIMSTDNTITGPINIGNTGEFTIGELAQLTRELTQTKSHFVYNPLPSDDPKRRRPNTTLAKELLGWQPVVVLRDGLEKTIDYFRSVLAHIPQEAELK